jgi:uncharacterized membrane protein YbhN (UPF0104 family)
LLANLAPALRLHLEGILAGLGQGLGLFRKPGAALQALAWSLLVWGLGALTNIVLLKALGIDVPAWGSWLVLVAVYAANFLPTAPAQIGVFEYACILALSVVSVEREAALAFGLLLHLLVYSPPLILGPICMVLEGLDWRVLMVEQNRGTS